jgi:predicted dehydrogenase
LVPGFGRPPDEEPPPDLDWGMFLGPAPMRPYNRNRGIYQFRWFWDYSGGQMTNWGQHSLDIVYWYLNTKGPTAVYSTGGRLFLEDNCETPDVQDTIMEHEGAGDGQPRWTFVNSTRECSRGRGTDPLTFFGTHGSLSIDRERLRIKPDRLIPAINVMPGVRQGHPVGGPKAVQQKGARKLRTERLEEGYYKPRQLLKLHTRNFLDCVKSRKEPVSDLESGHRVATALHLANLSLRLGRRIRWDAEKEDAIGDREASEMLVRPYRKPWDAELRALEVSKNGDR